MGHWSPVPGEPNAVSSFCPQALRQVCGTCLAEGAHRHFFACLKIGLWLLARDTTDAHRGSAGSLTDSGHLLPEQLSLKEGTRGQLLCLCVQNFCPERETQSKRSAIHSVPRAEKNRLN